MRRTSASLASPISAPTICDICSKPLNKHAVKAKTIYGPSAFMCPTCAKRLGASAATDKEKEDDMKS